MNKEEIVSEITARIRLRQNDSKYCGLRGRYSDALRLESQSDELINLLSVILDDTP